MKKHQPIFTLILFIACYISSYSQSPIPKKTENVVYGMASGSALLMDVYVPERANHKAIIYIPGSSWGFNYPDDYNQMALKSDYDLDSTYTRKWVNSLCSFGFTVFIINHRFTPRFHFRDIIADCRRAVRYVRYNAAQFKIDGAHIGAMGHSSGANLVGILGLSDTTNLDYSAPIDTVSSKVQATVTMAAPYNLTDLNSKNDSSMANLYVYSLLSTYMGHLPEEVNNTYILSGDYFDASPYALISDKASPMLMYCSDNDPIIPLRQATNMFTKLKAFNTPAKLIIKEKEGHTPKPDMSEVNKWFEQYLK